MHACQLMAKLQGLDLSQRPRGSAHEKHLHPKIKIVMCETKKSQETTWQCLSDDKQKDAAQAKTYFAAESLLAVQ